MDFEEVMKGRRSVRAFDTRSVSINTIFKIIDAARWAPTSGNVNDWEVVIIQKPERKFAIAEAAIGQYWMTRAPYILIFCSRIEKTKRLYGRRGEIYAIQNASAAIQNVLLEAYNEGLAGCWVGAFEEESIKSIIRAGDDLRVAALVPIGYPLENPAAPKRPELKSIVYFGKYGERELEK